MQKTISLLAAVVLLAATGFAQSPPVHVRQHTDKTGKVTPAHERTAPNQTQRDNWSTKGNTNPTNGKAGTKDAKK